MRLVWEKVEKVVLRMVSLEPESLETDRVDTSRKGPESKGDSANRDPPKRSTGRHPTVSPQSGQALCHSELSSSSPLMCPRGRPRFTRLAPERGCYPARRSTRALRAGRGWHVAGSRNYKENCAIPIQAQSLIRMNTTKPHTFY